MPAGFSLSKRDLSSATEGAQDAAGSAADDMKGPAANIKAKRALSGLSALRNSLAAVGDKNIDVPGLAQTYKDSTGAIQQGKSTGELGFFCGHG